MSFAWHIEVFDKSGVRVDILQPDVADLSWSYDVVGGCGECNISLRREFDNFGVVDLDHRIEVWRDVDIYGVDSGAKFATAQLSDAIGISEDGAVVFISGEDSMHRKVTRDATPSAAGELMDGTAWFLGSFGGSGAQLPMQLYGVVGVSDLRYSGFVSHLARVFDERESVRLKCSGFVRQAEYVIVDDRTYSGDVGAIAREIIDTFLLPATQIKRTIDFHLCEDLGILVSDIYFDSSAAEALAMLAEIGGNAEWGVRADREVFFCPARERSSRLLC